MAAEAKTAAHALFEHVKNAPVAERHAAAKALAEAVKANGVLTLELYMDDLKNPKSTHARDATLDTVTALAEVVGKGAEPHLLLLMPVVLDCLSDKVAATRTLAEKATKAVINLASDLALRRVLPVLFEGMSQGKKWQTKFGALQAIHGFVESAPEQVSACLPDILPHVADCMWDSKPEVKKLATTVMTAVSSRVGNPDIEPFLPYLVECIAEPSKVPDCVFRLAATTFVKTVEAPTLAIMVPVLSRALTERSPATLRQTAVIVDNMCKLVENPAHAEQFLPKLLPALERVSENAANPELRSVAARAVATLNRIAALDKTKFAPTPDVLFPTVRTLLDGVLDERHLNAFADPVKDMVAVIACELIANKHFDDEEWHIHFAPFLDTIVPHLQVDDFMRSFLAKCIELNNANEAKMAEAEDEEGEDLCNCEFSLAYGGMILLNNTRLHLKRGKRYGLCGPNGVGKSTLMRAINNGQVEGFPPADQLRTVFVEHNLQASEAELSVVDFLLNDSLLSSMPRAEVVTQLSSVGFTDDMQKQAVGSLSGGWKMKLELARAMLMKADILLLDEPTNHLDVTNVKWLEDYLTGLTDVTCLIVSHDSGFLDHVCTHIIHYETRKLKRYKGNLSEFVKKVPEAKSYYELEATSTKFTFPEPGFLDGVKSKDKAILKMSKVCFTYPGRDKPALTDISVACSLSSRIAVLGPNGAGKSTLIKLLTGELEPSAGEVIKHPNLRVAYVAQHAFHHIEQHLDLTPNQYIQWRYAYGEDREMRQKASRQISPEEEKLLKQIIMVDNEKRQIEEICGRRKGKRTFDYEIKWVGIPHEKNTWMSRESLEAIGLDKFIQAVDDKEAQMAGAYKRPLTSVNIEKHLQDVGLDPEFATHNRIRGLSGGQKVKVVIGAATWNHPHMIVLDEPTNYLDRDSLGALAGAIETFGGGVILITHHTEFTSKLCPEVWAVNAGRLKIEGKVSSIAQKIELKEKEETVDAFGNVEKVKSTRKLSRKELKAKERRKKSKLANGEALSSDEEDL
eukprot:Colp12_sorted_trinity150504_noHs@15451